MNLLYDVKKLDKWKISMILILIMVLSGIFGYIYEVIFYKIDLGYFVNRGTTFGPWIPIYAFGALFITIITYKFRNKPIVVFLLAALISGVLEFSTGFVLDKLFNTRLWDYNVEIWNWGNIGGYICFRSVAFFSLSSLFLMYVLLPLVEKFVSKYSKRTVTLIALIPGILFAIDIVLSLALSMF